MISSDTTAGPPSHSSADATADTPGGNDTSTTIAHPRRPADNTVDTAHQRRNPVLSQPLRLSVRRPGAGIVVVHITGEIDLASISRLTELIRQRLTAAVLRAVILDLSQVSFVNSGGVELLLHAQRRADQRGIGLYVITGDGCVHRLLKLAGVLDRFLRRATSAEAVAEARR